MKRKFNATEMILSEKSLKAMQDEAEWCEYQLLYYELMLKSGLEQNYKKNIRDFKDKKKDFESDLNLLKEKIKILQTQMREGVEILEEVKGGKNGE